MCNEEAKLIYFQDCLEKQQVEVGLSLESSAESLE